MRLRAVAIGWVMGVVLGCGGASGRGMGGTDGLAGRGGAAGGGGAGGGRLDASADEVPASCGSSRNPSSGVSCNSVEATGPCVTETVGTAVAAPAGGTIVAGTYDLVASTVYAYPDAGADAAVTLDQGPRQQTVVVSGSGATLTMESALMSGTEVQRLNVTLTASGDSVTLAPTCPLYDGGFNPTGTFRYTAISSSSTTTLILYDALNLDHLQVDEYVKR